MEKYRIFIETIKLLASPADIQLSVIPRQICCADEIAFCLEDILPLSEFLLSEGQISENIYKNVCDIDSNFVSFNHQEWTDTALMTSKKWQEVRDSASQILSTLSEAYSTPDLFWIRNIF